MRALNQIITPYVKALNAFIDDNGFQYSAAVSFYTLFSVAPIVVITVYVAGIFVGDESVMRQLTEFLSQNFGEESSQAVLLLIETIQTDDRNVLFFIGSIIFLLISATTIFVQFRDSFNQIFRVTVKQEVGFLKLFIDRLIALGMILILGAALLTSLVVDSAIVALFDFLSVHFESVSLVLAAATGNLLSLVMIFFAIFVMFYILPDVKLGWEPLIKGSLVTTFLLVVGKFGVGMLIGSSSLNELTGASSSIIILMLWVYYSSIIIFYGIELVKAFAQRGDEGIKAGKYTRIKKGKQ